MIRSFLLLLAGALAAAAGAAIADMPTIENATATRIDGDRWRIAVTLRHPDSGWDHYADGWEVLDQDGAGVGFRELMHPHVQEQPFTRSLTVTLPPGTTTLYVRARCSVDGLDYTNAYTIDLPQTPR